MSTKSHPVQIRTAADLHNALTATFSNANERFLFVHPGVTISPTDIALLESALDSLPLTVAVIARVFKYDRPHYVLNGCYWRGGQDPLWHSQVLGESSTYIGSLNIEPAFHSAQGAMLMSREIATRVGFYDVRFATHLADLDWQCRAHRLGVSCFVVRDARAMADPATYPTQLGERYAVVRDSLLLARKQGSFWPLEVCRLLFWWVFDVWRPFDFSLSGKLGVNPLRPLIWAIASYVRGLRMRFSDAESKATLAAVRDFLLNRYERRRFR